MVSLTERLHHDGTVGVRALPGARENALREQWGAFGDLAVGVARFLRVIDDSDSIGRHLDVQFVARYTKDAEGREIKNQVAITPNTTEIVQVWKGATPALSGLGLTDTAYPSYQFVRDCKGLRTLYAERSAFSDRDGKALEVHQDLDICYLDQSQISHIGFLTRHDLRKIGVANTKVSSIEPVRSHGRLELLDITKTGVTDLSALSGKEKLETLMVDGAPVKDFSPLLSCTGLKNLFIDKDQAQSPSMTQLRQALPALRVTVLE